MHKRYYDPKEEVVRKLLNIKQNAASIQIYNQAFTKIQLRLDKAIWIEEVLLDIYKWGLRREIYTSIAEQVGSTSWKIGEWMKYALHLKREGYNVKMRDRSTKLSWSNYNYRFKETQYVSMNVDKRTIKRSKSRRRNSKRSKLTRGVRQTTSRTLTFKNTCYLCKQSRHFTRDCKMKAYKATSQGNHSHNKRFQRQMI